MDLVFIHGTAAVGKLTVAKELAILTNFKLFHNHLAIELVKSLFPWGTKEFSKLTKKFRLDMIEAGAKYGIDGMIFTFCFRPGKNDEFVKTIRNIVEKHNGKVHFVHLDCDKEELYRRVINEERKKHNKINSIEELDEIMDRWGKISFVDNLEIDNTNLHPKEVAKIIVEKYKL